MSLNPLNYARGCVDALRLAVRDGARDAKAHFTNELRWVLPLLREFDPGDEHAELKAETLAAAESLLPKSATK